LPSLLAAAVLSSEGLRAVNLGPDTPMAAMRHAIAAHQPAMAWLSCSSPVKEDQAAEIAALAKSINQGGITLVIGGRHVADVATARAAYPVASMGELAAFARGLITAQRAAQR
jgi:cobalamin-dependent methionine synthase I